MVRPIVLECLGVAGPKELPEAAALRTDPVPSTVSCLPRGRTACTRKKRGQRGLSSQFQRTSHPFGQLPLLLLHT